MRAPIEKAVLLTQRDVEKNITFLSQAVIEHRTYIAAFSAKKIVGMAVGLETSVRIPGVMSLCFISTHQDHLDAGLASKLADSLFAFASSQDKAIANT